MAKIAIVTLFLFVAVLFSFSAHAATIDIGDALGALSPYVNAALSTAIFAGLAWGGYILKKKWGIEIDAKYRDAINAWAARMAADLVAKGAVKVQGLKIETNNEAVARTANAAIHAIPDAMAHFGLTPEKLEERIKSFVPTIPAVAAEVQSTPTPPASGTARPVTGAT